MEYAIKSGHPEKQRTACLVVGVFEPRRLSTRAEQLDKAAGGTISQLLRRGDLEGKVGQYLLLHQIEGPFADRVLLVGCGKERDFNENTFKRVLEKMTDVLSEMGAMEAVNMLTEMSIRSRDTHWKVRYAVEVIEQRLYQFTAFKSKPDTNRRPIRRMTFTVPTRRDLSTAESALARGQAIAGAMSLAKDLGNIPPNVCNGDYLAKQAKKIASDYKAVKTTVLEEAELKDLGMGALLAVGQASANPSKLITLEYQGADKAKKPIVLVGKGITYDTGGLSLKSSVGMPGMKFDMLGSATVLSVIRAAAELALPLNIITVMAVAENMVGPNAVRPDDIVTTMSGQTVEINNTDAEGRLVLCDALTYCERYEPDVVIDVATLTGAVIVALGHEACGLMSNHNPLAHDLLNAGTTACDRAWKLPIWDEYHTELKSPCADMKNSPGSPGTIMAACFLAQFTKKYHWAHLDIAGVGRDLKSAPKATGRPIPLLLQYLFDRCE